MPARLAADGRTTVILVLNMRRFIPDKAQRERFESLRGTPTFRESLARWPQWFQNHPLFTPLASAQTHDNSMSPEEIGFATGVFRRRTLELFQHPTYRLNKHALTFDKALMDNLQFKKLFLRALERWEIELRPTATGFFIIRLQQHYTRRSLEQLARDLIHLQQPFDIPSALKWLHKREREAKTPEELEQTRRSIHTLLRWLGADPENPDEARVLYYPLQWKLAIEVINHFVNSAPLELNPQDGPPIRLQPAAPSLRLPLHDAYILHYFERLLAHPSLIKGSSVEAPPGTKVEVTPNDFYEAKGLRNVLASFLEGSLLTPPNQTEPQYHFPAIRWRLADELLERNLASWKDEFCALGTRTGLILPARQWLDYELTVSTFPGSTLKVHYRRYWEAIERLVEFGLEAQVLARLVESETYRLSQELADNLEATRKGMEQGDVKIPPEVIKAITKAAHLQRLTALVQQMCQTQIWYRAEYAVQKAEALFSALGLHETLHHIQHNMDNINQSADHFDDLYLTDLTEKSNARANHFSLLLSALSLALIILMLPSFTTDLFSTFEQLNFSSSSLLVKSIAFSIVVLSLYFALAARKAVWPFWTRAKQIREMVDHLIQELPKSERELRNASSHPPTPQ